ncbi:4-phosphoerythronate dehydrogenase PdxB [Pseudomonas typographi]|uniref:Erythronate-4-phosphate dehydrogenase n=1 Tax=Pseudomonas typographi TaxID=2715964 RepID=A0ABR7Z1V3_9PSED|nr:4-phosphoerythronate dehydrogenase PdxB [Pseudomonas typographi]MBD1551698.1 4-phosphoerythronate dehydrogenase PdxB [Pseudomonas typographi]MBD1587047.1 4-phosphoerythronate dehydrogenase PdxB [Pseudomonas typographi]MBD1599286.1 4-phosphoerythronate dehydrogenase PdxB [Pseudomonas typographi]
MLIVADENIPLVDEFFGAFGAIRRVPGRQVSRTHLAGADALLVRSITQVDRALLEGTPVRFVGTCTIGTDHLALDYFAQAGIHWASAPGCNARGVVEYVLGSLLVLAEREGATLAGRTYGVVGVGQVGGRLVDALRALGWRVLACDPPRQAAEGGDFVTLDTLLAECDVVSLHTPLTQVGEYRTRHLLGAARLRGLRPGTWLINAARGPVIDNAALATVLAERPDLRAVLDVWEHEPSIDRALAARCAIATPHIAGHSLDGKQRGTAQVFDAFCQWQGVAPTVKLAELLPPPWLAQVVLDAGCDPEWAMAMLCRAVYDPRRDDADFRRSLHENEAAQRQAFDLLRKQYPYRREVEGLPVRVEGDSPALRQVVQALRARWVPVGSL